MFRATSRNNSYSRLQPRIKAEATVNADEDKNVATCEVCGEPAVEKKGTTQSGNNQSKSPKSC